MSNSNTEIAKDTKVERKISYIPFGEKEAIDLTIGTVKNFIAARTRSGKTPSNQDIVKFMMLCKSRELNPWVGDAYLVGYDSSDGPTFTLITGVQALFKRAENNGNYNGMESGVIIINADKKLEQRAGDLVLDSEELVGGWAKCYRKDQEHPTFDSLKFSTYSTGRSRWKADPAGMIVKCFDDKTEILTTEGFELFSEARGRILQVTNNGLEPTDSIPFVQQYEGPVIVNENQNLDFVVTPNHSMVTDRGRVDADEMFNAARLRPKHKIPRCTEHAGPGLLCSDQAIKMAAIYLCDGYDHDQWTFYVGVSKARKLEMLSTLGCHANLWECPSAGDVAVLDGREITTSLNKTIYSYRWDNVESLVSPGKRINTEAFLDMDRRQARLFIDTMLECGGRILHVKRFYQTNPRICGLFEIMAVQAGYSVNKFTRDNGNTCFKISSTTDIPVRKHANNADSLPSLERRKYSGDVWCVSVPSETIIVRRNGFSFICGNCAEASVLRKAFPNQLSGLVISEEMDATADGRPSGTGQVARSELNDVIDSHVVESQSNDESTPKEPQGPSDDPQPESPPKEDTNNPATDWRTSYASSLRFMTKIKDVEHLMRQYANNDELELSGEDLTWIQQQGDTKIESLRAKRRSSQPEGDEQGSLID